MTMSSPVRRVIGAALVLSAAASTLAAQSLADVARQEEARRKTVAAPGKVYTNDDVRPEPRPSAADPTPAVPTPPAADQAKSDEAAKPAGDDAAAGTEKQDQAYWQKRLTAARDSMSRARMFAEALQSRINALNTDFTNRDDPAQRAVVAKDRQQALAELERVQKEIEESTKAIAQIQDEGRRAGAPAGWLR
jgi:hypothetical protein